MPDFHVYSDADFSEKRDGMVVYGVKDEKAAVKSFLASVRGSDVKPAAGDFFVVSPVGESTHFTLRNPRVNVNFDLEVHE